MAAAARFLIRGANSKLSISGIGTGAQSSFGVTLLKLSPSCNSRVNTQRRHASHFTFQPDPVPTQYGEWRASRLTLAAFTEETCEAVKVSIVLLWSRHWQELTVIRNEPLLVFVTFPFIVLCQSLNCTVGAGWTSCTSIFKGPLDTQWGHVEMLCLE